MKKDRSSCPGVVCIKVVLKNFAKFTGEHLRRSLFFNKVADLKPTTLLKKSETPTQMFQCEFCEIFKNTFSTEHLRTTASKKYCSQMLDRMLFCSISDNSSQLQLLFQSSCRLGHVLSPCNYVKSITAASKGVIRTLSNI